MAYPTSPVPVREIITLTHPTYKSITHSQRYQVRTRPGAAFFAVRLEYTARSRADYEDLLAYLVSMQGMATTDNFALLQLANRGSDSSWNVNGAAQTGTSITVNNLTPSTAGVIKAGDYFNIGADGNGLFKATADVTSDGAGLGTVNFVPAINLAPPDTTACDSATPGMVIRLASDSVVMNLNQCSWYEPITVDLIEAQRDI